MVQVLSKLLDFLSSVAETTFWVGIAMFVLCLLGFVLVMVLAFMLSAFVAAL